MRSPVWTYFLSFVEVHKDYKGNKELKIGKNLFKILDSASFLKRHILERSLPDNDGFSFFSIKVGEYLKAKEYALVPAQPRLNSDNVLTKLRKYNKIGQLIK